jgi:hypothetical protein
MIGSEYHVLGPFVGSHWLLRQLGPIDFGEHRRQPGRFRPSRALHVELLDQ